MPLIGGKKLKNSIKAIGRDIYPELKGVWITMEFRKLKEGDFKYEIAEDGTCRNVKSKHIMTPDWGRNGYGRYTFTINGVKQKFLIHRLVLSAWGIVPQKYLDIGLNETSLQVNHKDGNKRNNHISNLEYITARENIRHRDRILQHVNTSDNWKKQQYSKKPVRCVENNLIFDSSYAAAHWLQDECGINSIAATISWGIRACCRGEHKIAYGFHWEFYNS